MFSHNPALTVLVEGAGLSLSVSDGTEKFSAGDEEGALRQGVQPRLEVDPGSTDETDVVTNPHAGSISESDHETGLALLATVGGAAERRVPHRNVQSLGFFDGIPCLNETTSGTDDHVRDVFRDGQAGDLSDS